MDSKIKEELEDFQKFKKEFVFTQKEIIQNGENLYCDDELVKLGEDKPIGETEKWINVGYNLKGAFSKTLSNLYKYEFDFQGEHLYSIETFFQGIKIKDKDIQKYVFKYSGIESNVIKVASDYNWKELGIIYWKGIPIKRNSKEYDNLVDELYISAIQNPLYRNVLKNVDKPVIHSIGEVNKEDTVFTRYEFEYMLNCLVAFLKNRI